MQNTLINSSKVAKNTFPRLEPKHVSFNAILVVYQVDEDDWKGFTHPYGETTEATSKKEAIQKLRVLADAYYATIKNYNFPTHLVNGHLDNIMDRKVFNWIVGNDSVMRKIYSKSGIADSVYYYAEAYRGKS